MHLVAQRESEMPILHIEGLSKRFKTGITALNNVSLKVRKGEMVALIGPSGSGKSTLIRHISGLEVSDPGGGTVKVLGRVIQANGKLASQVREIRARIGVIFQQFNLVGRLSVIMNVLTGSLYRVPYWRTMTCMFDEETKERALAALERVGIADHAWQRASTLSGGQQQRVAIARALVQNPEIILADEPIASLDPESATNVMELLYKINQEDRRTIIVSLHQVDFAFRYCPRIVALKRGQTIYDGPASALTAKDIKAIYGSETHGVKDQDSTRRITLIERLPRTNVGDLEEEEGAWAGIEHERIGEVPQDIRLSCAQRNQIRAT